MTVAERNFDIVRKSAMKWFRESLDYRLGGKSYPATGRDFGWHFPLYVCQEMWELVCNELSLKHVSTIEDLSEVYLQVDLTMLILLHQLSATAPHLPADLVDWEPTKAPVYQWAVMTCVGGPTL